MKKLVEWCDENGSARKFAEEMISSGTVDAIFRLREKYNLHMKVEGIFPMMKYLKQIRSLLKNEIAISKFEELIR